MKNLTGYGVVYKKQTDSIYVTAAPEYQNSRSLPFENIHIWSYHICIENKSSHTVQLINRHWQIIDAGGQVRDVIGAGVIGQQPVLEPGDKFEYTSDTSLTTPSGMMLGTYEMLTNTGEMLTIEIPTFSLDCPHIKESMN